jgi:hypothetical protein
LLHGLLQLLNGLSMDTKAIEKFWEELAQVESDFGLYLVHGYKDGSLIIDGNSDIVAIVNHGGELHILSENEFKDANRSVVVSGKFEI